MSRSTNILKLRKTFEVKTLDQESSGIEYFQNKVLRPIIKFQNSVILLKFKNVCRTYKSSFSTFSENEKKKYIENILLKDKKIRFTFIGLIIGLLSSNEFLFYLKHSSKINKRIISILIKRLIDNLDLIVDS